MGGQSGKVRKRTARAEDPASSRALAQVKPRKLSRQARPDQIALEKIGGDASLAAQGLSRSNWTPTQVETILEPFTVDELEILPGGEVYIPQIHVRNKLNKTFRPGNWGLDFDPPVEKGGRVIILCRLYVNGVAVAKAFGEGRYQASNKKHSWGKALESAKSNGLVRCVKDIGMANECWNGRWTARFRRENGVYVKRQRSSDGWRNVEGEPFDDEIDIDPNSPNADRYQRPTAKGRLAAKTRPRQDEDEDAASRADVRHTTSVQPAGDGPITEGALKNLIGHARTHEITDKALKDFLKAQFGYSSKKEILKSQFKAVKEWISAPYDVILEEAPPDNVDTKTGEVSEGKVVEV